MGTYAGAAAQDSDRLAADRAWVRWGMAAAVTGMLAWLAGFALIPLDAKLDKGDQHLAQVLRAHTGQLGERPGAELVFGVVGKPWQPVARGSGEPVAAEQFAGSARARGARRLPAKARR